MNCRASRNIGKSVARRAAEARGFDPVAHALHRRRIAREQIDLARESQPDSFRDFARHVAFATAGPILRYSKRLQLLDLAERGGIARFDANLIIAAIEHRNANSSPGIRQSISSSRPALLVGAVIGLQAAIVLSVWLTLLH